MTVSRIQIARDLRRLGLRQGDIVLVHSSLSSLGRVRGGAATLIDALLDVLGSEGTLLMPALSGGVFDVKTSPSVVGAVAEAFRQRPGVLRSFHPSHSVLAFGKYAAELLEGHFDCPTPYGAGTPYAKLMDRGGKVLLLGVDQDRNTSLHTLESLAGAPYLKTITREYVDPESGTVKAKDLHDYAGPHRDFIGLDHLFRTTGVMTVGKVGSAVSRLMDAAGMREVGLQALRDDPAAVLCDNSACLDCVTQRAAIKRQQFAAEDFCLSVVSDVAGDTIAEIAETITAEGISCVELRRLQGREITSFSEAELNTVRDELQEHGISVTAVSSSFMMCDGAGLVAAAALLGAPAAVVPFAAFEPAWARLAARRKVNLRLENVAETESDCAEVLAATGKVSVAFNPANFAAAGRKPFLQSFYKGEVRRRTSQIYLNDGTFAGEAALLAGGNAEIKEIVSIARCHAFAGPLVLKPRDDSVSFTDQMRSFWELLKTI